MALKEVRDDKRDCRKAGGKSHLSPTKRERIDLSRARQEAPPDWEGAARRRIRVIASFLASLA